MRFESTHLHVGWTHSYREGGRRSGVRAMPRAVGWYEVVARVHVIGATDNERWSYSSVSTAKNWPPLVCLWHQFSSGKRGLR